MYFLEDVLACLITRAVLDDAVSQNELTSHIIIFQVKLKPSQLSHDSSCTLPYASLVTWQALVNEAGNDPTKKIPLLVWKHTKLFNVLVKLLV